MAKSIGPAFPDELKTASLMGLPFSWTPDGRIQFDPRMTPAQIAAVQVIYAAHDPTKTVPDPRPTQAQIQASIGTATTVADLKAALVLLAQRLN